MTTFGFSEDEELVPVDPGGFASNAAFSDFHISAPPTLEYLAEMHKAMDKSMGVPSTLLMNPDMFNEVRNWPWDRTGQGLNQTVLQQQRVMNGIQNSILDSIRIVADKYCPLTVRRQFRFPRSKKKRIRKKWAKDQSNWKDVRIAFRWIDPESFFKVTYPDGKERLQVRPGLEKRNAVFFGGPDGI